MLAVDVSGSMAADDVAPYRLRAAQDAALTFADEVPRQFQVGLVSFSGQANLLVAPTTDRAALRRAIDGLTPDGATAIGEAVLTSLDAIRTAQNAGGEGQPLESARIVVLSDGATTVGVAPQQAAAEAKQAGVPIYTVALGTADGVLPNGQPVPPDRAGAEGDRRHHRGLRLQERGRRVGAPGVRAPGLLHRHRARALRGHRLARGHRRRPAGAGRRGGVAGRAAALMSFQSPMWLWALLLLPLLAAGLAGLAALLAPGGRRSGPTRG